jgi:hypothetical protein
MRTASRALTHTRNDLLGPLQPGDHSMLQIYVANDITIVDGLANDG